MMEKRNVLRNVVTITNLAMKSAMTGTNRIMMDAQANANWNKAFNAIEVDASDYNIRILL